MCDSMMVLQQAIRLLDWNIVDEHEQWDVFWSNQFPAVSFCRKMKRFQCINHFSGMYEICRKDLLARNLIYMQKFHPNQYDFFPTTWVFPYDFNAANDYSQCHPNSIFIMKPVTGSMGRGIEVRKSLKDSMRFERIVCQIYINEPLLLDGYKFDLRVYALVASIDPLRIYVYNEGLVRLATQAYEFPSQSNIRNKFMHLTNYSINKYSATFSQDHELGSKRMFQSFNKLFEAEGHDVCKLWQDIDDIILKTILSIRPQLLHAYRAIFPSHDRISACFEILGFDIIIDRTLRPYLLEVNQSPSFNNNTQIDDTVKTNLVRDTLNLLNISAKSRQRVLHEDRARILGRKQQQPNRSDRQQASGDSFDIDMGYFRRLDSTNYSDSMMSGIQASLYNDTALSRTRATFGQKKRQQFEKHTNAKTINSKTADLTMKRVEKKDMARSSHSIGHRLASNRHVDRDHGYFPTEICLRDEMQRVNELCRRDSLVRNMGIVDLIYEAFQSNSSLN